MRTGALTVGVFLLFMACAPEGHDQCNLHVTAPLQLDGAAIAVDGVQTSSLVPIALEHPLRSLLLRLMGSELRSAVASGACHIPAGTHTVRVVKPGWEPIERVVVVDQSSRTIELTICPVDLRSHP
jgi:hypothetical protein